MSKLYINQSVIKAFFYKGEKRDYCAQYIKRQCIDKEVGRETLAMTCGNYFETQCLGSSIGGKQTDDLPRKKLTSKQIIAGQTIGDKTIDQIRIDQQVMMFNKKKAEYQISIEKDVNTQIGIKKLWSKNDNIVLQGELDIFPASIALPQRGLRLCVIDLKLTGKFSDYGEYCWGTPSNLDPIQGNMYNELVRDIDLEFNMIENPDSRLMNVYTPTVERILKQNEPLFFFWVFNYKEEIANKFIEVEYNEMARKELYEAIRKTVEEINKNERDNWQATRPDVNNCNQCAIFNCPVREAFQKPVVEHNDFEKI
jgi:hypothetical protein